MIPSTLDVPDHDCPAGQRCQHYRDAYGWPVTLDRSTSEINLVIAGLVGAITMPPEFGRRVLRGLTVRMLTGPVFERPLAQLWTFITGPGLTPNEAVLADLHRLGMAIVPQRSRIILPSPEDEDLGVRKWVLDPSEVRDLPPQQTVIATARGMSVSTVL